MSGRVRALLGYSCESEVARLVRLGGSRGALSCVTWGAREAWIDRTCYTPFTADCVQSCFAATYPKTIPYRYAKGTARRTRAWLKRARSLRRCCGVTTAKCTPNTSAGAKAALVLIRVPQLAAILPGRATRLRHADKGQARFLDWKHVARDIVVTAVPLTSVPAPPVRPWRCLLH